MIDIRVQVDDVFGVEIASADLETLVGSVIVAEGQGDNDWEVTLVLTGDAHIQQLHRDFMGIDSATDVMTFPADPEPGSTVSGGDVVISVERAIEQAAEFGNTGWDEVRFLAVHGALHLCGWSDETDDLRAEMLARQVALIAAFDREAKEE